MATPFGEDELREGEVAEDDPAEAAERRKRPTPLLSPPRVAAALADHGLTPIALEGEGDEGDEDYDGTRVSAQSAELAQIIAGEQRDEDFVEDAATHDFGDAAEIIAKVDMQRAAARGEVEAIEAADNDDEPAFFEDDATEIDMLEPHHDSGVEALPSAEVVIPLPGALDPYDASQDAPHDAPHDAPLAAPHAPQDEPAPEPRRRSRVPLIILMLLLVLVGAAAACWLYWMDGLSVLQG